MYINGNVQWIDSKGIVKTTTSLISDNITIASGINALSTGPISINTGNTVTVSSGAVWTIV